MSHSLATPTAASALRAYFTRVWTDPDSRSTMVGLGGVLLFFLLWLTLWIIDPPLFRYDPSQLARDQNAARDFNIELSKAPDKPDAAALAKNAPAAVAPKVSTFTLATLATGIDLLGGALIAQVASGSNPTGISRTAAFFAGGGTGVTVVGGLMLYFDLSPGKAPAGGVTWNDTGLEHGMSH